MTTATTPPAVHPFPPGSFVRNSGRYWHGTTGREYVPTVRVPDPFPPSAYLHWGLEEKGASPDHHRLLHALQVHTGIGVNAFSIKNLPNGFAFEIYVTMYPPLLAQMHGREMPRMRLTEWEPDLNYFLAFEQEFFDQPRRVHDQASLGLVDLFAIHFDLQERIFREREIAEYTLSTRVGRERQLPAKPGLWKGYLWDKTNRPLVEEQHGFVVDPVAHEREMLEFLAGAARKEGGSTSLDPRSLLVPWLFEHTRDRHRLLGLTHKPWKGGLGVYYRLDLDALLRFFGEYGWPERFVRRFEEHRPRLEHLSFDVALAYRVSDGGTRPLRTALYGMV